MEETPTDVFEKKVSSMDKDLLAVALKWKKFPLICVNIIHRQLWFASGKNATEYIKYYLRWIRNPCAIQVEEIATQSSIREKKCVRKH